MTTKNGQNVISYFEDVATPTDVLNLEVKRGSILNFITDTASQKNTRIRVSFNNESSVNVVNIRFLMTDDSGSGDPIIAEVKFDRVPSRSSRTKTTTLPTGIEKLAVTYFVEGDPEMYSTFGLGDNATEIKLTFTD